MRRHNPAEPLLFPTQPRHAHPHTPFSHALTITQVVARTQQYSHVLKVGVHGPPAEADRVRAALKIKDKGKMRKKKASAKGASSHTVTEVAGSIFDRIGRQTAERTQVMAVQPLMVATALLPHQRQALKWMMDRETEVHLDNHNTSTNLFWRKSGPTLCVCFFFCAFDLPRPLGRYVTISCFSELNRCSLCFDMIAPPPLFSHSLAESGNLYVNVLTHFRTSRPPAFARGGVLADDMGLGKTITTLSLIALARERYPDLAVNRLAALIVCPLSVVSNWADQIEEHLGPGFDGRRLSVRCLFLLSFVSVLAPLLVLFLCCFCALLCCFLCCFFFCGLCAPLAIFVSVLVCP